MDTVTEIVSRPLSPITFLSSEEQKGVLSYLINIGQETLKVAENDVLPNDYGHPSWSKSRVIATEYLLAWRTLRTAESIYRGEISLQGEDRIIQLLLKQVEDLVANILAAGYVPNFPYFPSTTVD